MTDGEQTLSLYVPVSYDSHKCGHKERNYTVCRKEPLDLTAQPGLGQIPSNRYKISAPDCILQKNQSYQPKLEFSTDVI